MCWEGQGVEGVSDREGRVEGVSGERGIGCNMSDYLSPCAGRGKQGVEGMSGGRGIILSVSQRTRRMGGGWLINTC